MSEERTFTSDCMKYIEERPLKIINGWLMDNTTAQIDLDNIFVIADSYGKAVREILNIESEIREIGWKIKELIDYYLNKKMSRKNDTTLREKFFNPIITRLTTRCDSSPRLHSVIDYESKTLFKCSISIEIHWFFEFDFFHKEKRQFAYHRGIFPKTYFLPIFKQAFKKAVNYKFDKIFNSPNVIYTKDRDWIYDSELDRRIEESDIIDQSIFNFSSEDEFLYSFN